MITLDKAYEILGLSPDASDEEVKKAYKKQAMETHPDTHPNDPYATVKFQLLQEAKAKIDEERRNSRNKGHTEYQSSSSDNNSTNQNSYSSYNNSSYNSYSYNNSYRNNREDSNGYYSNRRGRSNFASKRSAVMGNLNEIYSNIKKNRYINIEENASNREIAYKCAYGALLRHALECILHDKAKEIHIITERRSSDELLTFIIDNCFFDLKMKETFYEAKRITNKLTHIEHFSDSEITFESCQKFYYQKFKPIIESHLTSNKKRNQFYLQEIYDQLENFSIKDRLTSTLLLGSVMRQILECIVDLWVYNEGLACEERANIKDKLDILKSHSLEAGKKKSYISDYTLDNLHSIRKAVNQAMHVSPDNDMNISKIHSALMAQTGALDVEMEMPTDEQILISTGSFSWKTVLKWICFFPILIPAKIIKSNMGSLAKLILTIMSIHFSIIAVFGIGYGLFVALPMYIEEKNDTVITIDVEKMSNQLITGYNNYGYFSKDEFCETMNIKDDEYKVTVKRDRVDNEGVYFNATVEKNNTSVGVAQIKATCPRYLYNGGSIGFVVYNPIKNDYSIELKNSDVTVSNLENVEVTDMEREVTKVSQINSDSMEKMKAHAEAVHQSSVEKWKSPDTCKGRNFIGTYLLRAKSKEQKETKSILYLIYKVDVITKTDNFSYYWYIKYRNITILSDGTATFDFQDYLTPTKGYLGSSGEYFKKGDSTYAGYENLNDLYTGCVKKVSDEYTCENLVK